jgi:hypothetical protein
MAKRTGEWDTYKESVTHYKKEIRKAERSSWRGYCQKIDDVPGGARLTKITAKQAINMVGSMKWPNGCHTQTASEALQELCRVHFPDLDQMIS